MKNIGRYIDGYNICQRIKNYIEAPGGKADSKQSTRKTVNTSNGRLYYRAAVNS